MSSGRIGPSSFMLDDQTTLELLSGAGLLQRQQAATLAAQARKAGRPAYFVAVENSHVPEDDAVAVIAGALGVSSVSLRDFQRDPQLASLIPAHLARERGILPIGVMAEGASRRLFLAMLDPADLRTVGEVRSALAMEVVAVLAGPVDLRAAIERVYKPAVPGAGSSALGVSAPPRTGPARAQARPPVSDEHLESVLEDLYEQPASDMMSVLNMLDEPQPKRQRDDMATPKSGLFALPDGAAASASAAAPAQQAPKGRFPVSKAQKKTGNFEAVGGTGTPDAAVAAALLQSTPPDRVLRALVSLLVRKGLITESELAEELRRKS